jgi:hypothetical protein
MHNLTICLQLPLSFLTSLCVSLLSGRKSALWLFLILIGNNSFVGSSVDFTDYHYINVNDLVSESYNLLAQ